MGAYILRRLLLMIPTMIGIMGISFLVVQFAPGGPVEQVIAQLTGQGDSASDRLSGGGDLLGSQGGGFEDNSRYRGAQGLDPEFIAKLEKQFGFDKPPLERFLDMMWDYIRFDFGESFFRDASVMDLIKDKLPVSITLGFWMTHASPMADLDPARASQGGQGRVRFDIWTSGSSSSATQSRASFSHPADRAVRRRLLLDWFPLRGLVSENFAQLSWWEKIIDYLLASDIADDRHGAVGLRDDDAADQELLPRRDPQAVCGHRACEGAARAAACSTDTSSATPC
jgi:microcin C transport system permease protein